MSKPPFPTKTITIPDHAATGANCRARRLAAGKTLRAVARKMGVSAPHLCALERGKRNWSVRLLGRFYRATQPAPAPEALAVTHANFT